MTANEPQPEDPEALGQRLRALQERIQARSPAPAARSPKSATSDAGADILKGLRAGSEFVAAVIVGAAIGWGLDWLLRTKPLVTILFFGLGVVAGVINVIRATSPKGANFDRKYGLSGEKADAKDVPRVRPRGGKTQED